MSLLWIRIANCEIITAKERLNKTGKIKIDNHIFFLYQFIDDINQCSLGFNDEHVHKAVFIHNSSGMRVNR